MKEKGELRGRKNKDKGVTNIRKKERSLFGCSG